MSDCFHPSTATRLMTDLEKTIEGETFYKDFKQPYEADREPTDRHNGVPSVNSTAISTKVREDSVFKPDDQHHAARSQLIESKTKTPLSILGEFMDESYFET
ncbi:MAG: hypothetical protein Q9223_003248, partial [Gallowayella weberi]